MLKNAWSIWFIFYGQCTNLSIGQFTNERIAIKRLFFTYTWLTLTAFTP